MDFSQSKNARLLNFYILPVRLETSHRVIPPPKVSVLCIPNITIVTLIGPLLPDSAQGSKIMVQHPAGGVVVVSYKTDIFHLPHAATSWITLKQKLQFPRAWTTAILIPDNIVKCTANKK